MDRPSRLIQYLLLRDDLSAREREALADLPSRRVQFSNGDRIISEGPAPDESCLLIGGMAIRSHRIGADRTVVSALHVCGDFLDLHAFLLSHLDHDVVALGPCEVEMVPADALRRVTEEHPHLTRMLWLSTLIDAKIHRTWIAMRAALPAARRIGHFLAELHLRLSAVGLVDGPAFDVAFDQRRLAEVLGYSVVHVNRAVRDLRADGLLVWEGRTITLPDLPRLSRMCHFDPAYLEFGARPR